MSLENIQEAIETSRREEKKDYSQEELNFDIARNLQEKLESHIASLDVVGYLLGIASDEVTEGGIGYGISHFISEWVKEHKRIIEEVAEEATEKPKYVLHRANKILSQIGQGRKVSTFTDIGKTIKGLERTIKVFGSMYRPEANRLLISLREIQDYYEKKEVKSSKE